MTLRARRAEVDGVVQGVGFRPFVARLAAALGLAGAVRNDGGRVVIVVEAADAAPLDAFAARLLAEAPAAAAIAAVRWQDVAPTGRAGFTVTPSGEGAAGRAAIPPDLAPCPACLAEIAGAGRRAGYPFTTCTDCGPRYATAVGLPWDRARTTLAAFPLCPACAAEYADPADRRFHAETLACPACGPSLALVDPAGAVAARRADALDQAVALLGHGGILALQGVGGYQLLVDARRDPAVRRLRALKGRPHKPLAVLVADLAAARRLAPLDPAEEAALTGPAAPIVLVTARGEPLARSVAPGLARLGVMLPASPLHALLARGCGGPLVCTSGNRHDDPVVIDDAEALALLGPLCDALLVHDRPIARRADDSVVQINLARPQALRLGRGLCPLTLPLPGAAAAPPILAVGGHLKQAPALVAAGRITQWAHVGTLDSPASRRAMASALEDLPRFVGVAPEALACDLHPDYATTLWAASRGLPVVAVQHHHAHVAACLAEHGLDRGLGVAWDGFGLGDDGGLQGGELLEVGPEGARRVGHLARFRLPGGEAAARDGRRALAGVLASCGLPAPSPDVARLMEVAAIASASPWSTSAGRLFDAAAAALGVAERSRYEGEAAILLEQAAWDHVGPAEPYPARLGPDGVLDHRPLWPALLAERDAPARAAARFHETLAALVEAAVARAGAPVVALCGGVFANRLLARRVTARLAARGVRALLPARVPPGDGGLALGQAAAAAWRLAAR